MSDNQPEDGSLLEISCQEIVNMPDNLESSILGLDYITIDPSQHSLTSTEPEEIGQNQHEVSSAPVDQSTPAKVVHACPKSDDSRKTTKMMKVMKCEYQECGFTTKYKSSLIRHKRVKHDKNFK